MAYQDRNRLWFGTHSSGMRWLPTPLSGAEMSPEGWSNGGTLLNGGGYQQNSFGSHKTYTFEWPESSSREAASLMKAYADGTYGRGLIYFVDPLLYDQNILPAQWADPSMVLDCEGASHVYGGTPTGAGVYRDTIVSSWTSTVNGSPSIQSASGVEVRRNLINNSTFRTNTTGWLVGKGGGGAASLARMGTATPNLAGTTSYARITVTTAGTWFQAVTDTDPGSITPGATYTLSAAVRTTPNQTDTRLAISWMDASGTVLSETSQANQPTTGNYAWVSVTGVAPVGASWARVYIRSANSVVGEILDITGVMLEQSSVRGTYFDGATPTFFGPVPGAPLQTNNFPSLKAVYDLSYIASGFRGGEDAVFVPIPDGYSLLLGAVYTSTGSGGIFASWQDSNGVIQSAQRLTQVTGNSGDNLLPDLAINGEGVWLWIGKSASGAASVTVTAMIARLVKTSDLDTGTVYGDGFYGEFAYGGALPYRVTKLFNGPWQSGMGHSGCRFIGKPTYIANTGVNGGQVSYSASFREIGMWSA